MENNVFQRLYAVVADRKVHPQEGSYTCYLFDKGLDKILKKLAEECGETIIAAKNGDNTDTVGELADLFYHAMVLMNAQDIPMEALTHELAQRTQKIGNLKQLGEKNFN